MHCAQTACASRAHTRSVPPRGVAAIPCTGRTVTITLTGPTSTARRPCHSAWCASPARRCSSRSRTPSRSLRTAPAASSHARSSPSVSASTRTGHQKGHWNATSSLCRSARSIASAPSRPRPPASAPAAPRAPAAPAASSPSPGHSSNAPSATTAVSAIGTSCAKRKHSVSRRDLRPNTSTCAFCSTADRSGRERSDGKPGGAAAPSETPGARRGRKCGASGGKGRKPSSSQRTGQARSAGKCRGIGVGSACRTAPSHTKRRFGPSALRARSSGESAAGSSEAVAARSAAASMNGISTTPSHSQFLPSMSHLPRPALLRDGDAQGARQGGAAPEVARVELLDARVAHQRSHRPGQEPRACGRQHCEELLERLKGHARLQGRRAARESSAGLGEVRRERRVVVREEPLPRRTPAPPAPP